MEKKWVNYHKHTSLSHLYLKDSPLVNSDYWNVLKERYGNETCVFTTVEHGWAGTYFRTYDELEKFNKKNDTKIKFVFGVEGYWVKDRHSTDSANCHIILLAKNDHGRKAINKALSTANKDGYYYRARLDLELLLSLPKDDVMVTTACVAFWRYDDIDDIVLKLHNHFRDFYLEVQPHNTDKQKEINRHIVELSAKYNIPLIAGCDSHVINESQLADREDLLASSHIKYEDEEGWYMDYPTYDILVERFMQQGVLSKSQIIAAIENTNVIFDFEDIVLDRSLKVPVVKWLRDKTQEERNAVFEKILADEWKRQRWDIDESKLAQYQQEIKHDIAEIEACNMADYFILSYYIMKYGQEKYGGVLTPTGRGSAVGMFLNKLLGLTNVDKVTSSVLMYSERFLTKERVLETHTPPDIDNNVSDRQPFIEAQRELVGELGTYDLIALGTLKLKSAWKMYARANNVEPETANNISKQLDEYEKAKKYAEEDEEIDIQDYVSQEYLTLVNGCQKYLGIIDNCKGHPCSTVAYDGDVESDIGVILCKSETTKKSVLAAVIESGTIDAFGYLKQDYLIVDSIGLIYDIYKEIGIDTLTVNQLLAKVKDDKKVWDIYANGYTQCVNQCEQEKTTAKVMRYRPQNISELTQFVASVRPSFQSMYKTFERREHFEYGIKAFDNLLQDEFCQSSFILYQESLMKVLSFAGFAMSETYGIIKAISKKKESVIASAEQKFIDGFSKNILETGETSDIEQAKTLSKSVWRIIQDSSAYSFNCVSGDTVIKRVSLEGSRYVPTIAEMYKIKNDIEYAKQTGHYSLYQKYHARGYGYGLSMKNGKAYPNKIIDIYERPVSQTFLIKTESGKEIKATKEHKFPTPTGIKIVGELNVGDELYVLDGYKKKPFCSRLTSSFAPNYPKSGQMGFQKNPNGASVVYDAFRKQNVEKKNPCQCCGKEWSKMERFEVHHIDGNRLNNSFENYEWLCCSCHKKKHFAMGRTKRYGRGVDVKLEKIVSITPKELEVVYDVEMSGDIEHNFATDNGIITCNCAHAYCMAIDSVTIAYLKAYYPLEFYKVALTRFTKKGEKDKVSKIEQELLARGFKLRDLRWGDDNRAFNIDRKDNAIIPTMTSVKDMPKTAPAALHDLYHHSNIKNRGELYAALSGLDGLNKTAIDILFKLDYFHQFGSPKRLIAEYEIFQKYMDCKVLTKSKLTDSEIEIVRQCAEKETDKQFRDLDNRKLVSLMIKNADIPSTTTLDIIRWQLEILGHSVLRDKNFAPNFWLVQKVTTNSYGTTKIDVYNLCLGVMKTYKVSKPWFAKTPCEKGNVIQCVMTDKPKFRKDANGKYVETGEYETIIKVYKIMLDK